MTVEETFIAAATERHLCELTQTTGVIRLVEPYMVFTTRAGRRLFHCYQITVYERAGRQRGWRNPRVESVVEARVVPVSFAPRPAYNPFNERLFPSVQFALPTRDGRVRPPTDPAAGEGDA